MARPLQINVKRGVMTISVSDLEKVADDLYAEYERRPDDFKAGKMDVVENLLKRVHERPTTQFVSL